MRTTAILAVIFVFATVASAQTRTVTNADLEKFRQARLKAEKDLEERYKEMGFPSPEELRKQAEKDRTEREALAKRLFEERMQRERQEAAREAAARAADSVQYYYSDRDQYSPGFYQAYFYPRYYRPFRVRQFSPPINVGNGIPVVNYYGTPFISRPRPVFRTRRN
ncbi:MAG: hypothetical protein IPM25_13535 [Chloracidobacterium sp.]|nr:hypothetical protein [Chloracidobacterium sp.]